MRKTLRMLLCLALLAGILPLYAAQASEPGTGVPGLKQVQVLNSCEIVLVFDRAITYEGRDGGYPGEFPCSPSAEEGGSPEEITVAVPGGDALDLAAVVNGGDRLLLVLDQPLAGQELLDITIEPGVIAFEESGEPFELTAYRVMTPLGTLGLMTQLDPQRTGFHVGHAVQYMRGPGAVSVAGGAGVDHQDASFLLSLVEVGPVDKLPLMEWIERAMGALASGEGHLVAARQELERELASAHQLDESAGHRQVRAQTVALERALAAFVRSYEEPEPEPEFGAEVIRFYDDGAIFGFEIGFSEPIMESSKGTFEELVERVELYYTGEEEPALHPDSYWSVSWGDDGSIMEINFYSGEFPFGFSPIDFDRVELYFVEGGPVSVSGAVYPAGVPVVGNYGSWWPEEPEEPLTVIAGALSYGDSMMHSFRVQFSEPLGAIDDLVSRVEVYYGDEEYDTYEGEQLAFSDFDDAPSQRFEIFLLSEPLPDLTEVKDVLVYFSDEVATEPAHFRPVDIELHEQMGEVYVPESSSGWDLLRFLSLHGYGELDIKDGDRYVERGDAMSSGMTLWDEEEPVLDILVHRLYEDSEPPAASFRNVDGIDRIKKAYDWQYYDRRPGGHFWDEESAMALIADEAAFRSAMEDEAVERVLLLDNLDLTASFTFPNRDLWLGGEGLLLTIPGVVEYRPSRQWVDPGLTIIDTSLVAPPEVAYLPEFAVLYEEWAIHIGFAEPLAEEQQERWLPRIKSAFEQGFGLQPDDIAVTVNSQEASVVTISNTSDRTLNFLERPIYLRSDLHHPFSPQVKIFDPHPLQVELSLLADAGPDMTKLAVAFNHQLDEETLARPVYELIEGLSYWWGGEQVLLQDQIADFQWVQEANGPVLVLTIGDYEYDEEDQHNLQLRFQHDAIRTAEGYKLWPDRFFSLLPTV